MLGRFEHLLVPVGFRESDDTLLEFLLQAEEAASRPRVTLLHVIEAIEDEPEESETDAELEEFYRTLESNARSRLETIAARLGEAGLSVSQEIVFGQRANEIVRFTMDREVDLVLLRSPRVDPQRPPEEWRSLSHQLSIFCQCPVLLLR